MYKRTPVLTDATMHYCPGCGHGVVHRIIAEVIEEMGIQNNVVGISPVGCKVPVEHYGRYGGVIPTPVEILDALKKMVK